MKAIAQESRTPGYSSSENREGASRVLFRQRVPLTRCRTVDS